MNDSAPRKLPVPTNDPRLQAALEDYFDRVDRGEPVDPENFVAQHPEIADELRQFITTEDELRRFAAESFRDISQISTGVFSQPGRETLPPRSAGAARDGQSSQSDLSGQFGRYQIIRSLGKGAMGTVYLAQDTQLERQVALKTPQFSADSEQESLVRFYREARAAAAFRHPRICPVYDVGDIEGQHYITMAYIEGRPLSDFVNPAKPQSMRQILVAVGKLAEALQEAHDHGIVHRDLKPSNIMVDRHGEPVIMDFGLAHQTRSEDDFRLTQTGVILGSPAYMAPEQVEGNQALIGPATDQYGLGVILYELLTGKVPFVGSLTSVMGQIIEKQPTPPSQYRPGLDPRIETVCLKMLAKKPQDRFGSLSVVATELAAIVRDQAIKPAPTPRRNSRTWWAVGSAAVAVGVLAAAVVLYMKVGKTLVEIDIKDPGIQVAFKGSSITLTGKASEQISIEPGEHELTITHGDLKFKTEKFKLERGNKEVVSVSLAGPAVAARLGDSDLIVIPISAGAKPLGAKASDQATAQQVVAASPAPASVSGASPIATKPADSRPQESQPAGNPALATAPTPGLLLLLFDEPTARRAQREWAAYAHVPVETTNSVGLKFALVPPGEYVMGAEPGHQVRITRPCYFGLYEVTRGQFAQYISATGYHTVAEEMPGGIGLEDTEVAAKWDPNKQFTWRNPGFPQHDNHPVVQITWREAGAYCEWLSRKEGKKYRLPTEAEWEYACRAGTATRFYNGNDLEEVTQISNCADATAHAVFPHWKGVKSSDGYIYTAPVGHYRPNNFGLYDMLGNVTEWCSDWQAADYYKHSPIDDPQGPALGTMHVARGAGFTHVGGARYRYYGVETYRRPDWGFRVVCDIDLPASGPEASPADRAAKRP
jgi:serine/threonine protein kinase/formylglycine-generating enzyme required for sulfatase activity